MTSRSRLLVPAIGLGAGAATSFLGIGGGAIIVPLLMIAVGLPFKEAVGTSLAAVLVISTVGVISTLAVDASNVAWMVAAVLTAGTLTGSLIGGRVLARKSIENRMWFRSGTFIQALGWEQELQGSVAVEVFPSETNRKKPSASLARSAAGPDQLSIYFDGGGVKCG